MRIVAVYVVAKSGKHFHFTAESVSVCVKYGSSPTLRGVSSSVRRTHSSVLVRTPQNDYTGAAVISLVRQSAASPHSVHSATATHPNFLSPSLLDYWSHFTLYHCAPGCHSEAGLCLL